ncbi:MAG: hypothetical protein HYS13_13900 [Planctomycetia bacterium]|nr:hypothetical protein [Planctomycetia bacterium]
MFQFKLWHLFAVVIWAAVVFWIVRQIGPLPTAGLIGVVLIAASIRLGVVVTQSLQDHWSGGDADRWPQRPIVVRTKTAACYLAGLLIALLLSLAVVAVLWSLHLALTGEEWGIQPARE